MTDQLLKEKHELEDKLAKNNEADVKRQLEFETRNVELMQQLRLNEVADASRERALQAELNVTTAASSCLKPPPSVCCPLLLSLLLLPPLCRHRNCRHY